MKIKRFKNLWTMDLILIIVIYVVYFILKMTIPGFIVGIAELPGVVAFGTYVDTHPWAYYLFNGSVSFITCYVFCCACCRQKYLNYKECTILLFGTILWYVLAHYVPTLAEPFNYVYFIALPALFLRMRREVRIKYFYSTAVCFTIHILLQYVLAIIKDLTVLVTYPNSATFTILLIDGFIWLIGLYLFYNKGGEKQWVD